jgi:hypothetical protein
MRTLGASSSLLVIRTVTMVVATMLACRSQGSASVCSAGAWGGIEEWWEVRCCEEERGERGGFYSRGQSSVGGRAAASANGWREVTLGRCWAMMFARLASSLELCCASPCGRTRPGMGVSSRTRACSGWRGRDGLGVANSSGRHWLIISSGRVSGELAEQVDWRGLGQKKR